MRNTVVFTSLVLMTTLFTYIALMTHRDSSEDQVFLQSLVTENTLLFLYVLRYPASVAYYSGYKVERLEIKNDIEAKRPQGMTWNDTKVMPFYAGEDLPDDRDILIISDKTGDAVKSGELPRKWKEVGRQGRFTFFKRIHP